MEIIISEDFHKAYRHRGLISPDHKRFWINIPKNGSNTISQIIFHQQRWRDAHYHQYSNLTKYAFVRDPVDRWKKCTIELCYHHFEHNSFVEDWDLFHKVFEDRKWYEFYNHPLDLHHVPQSRFIDRDTEVYYLNDKNITKVFGLISPIVRVNQSAGNNWKERIEPFVDSLMTKEFVDIIKEFYAEDYKLLETRLK